MNDIIFTGTTYIGTYLFTKYVFNYAVNKAADKVIQTSVDLSKRTAKHVYDKVTTKQIEYFEYDLIDINTDTGIDIIHVIETA